LLTGAYGQVAAPTLIVDPIDDSKRIVLPGKSRPEVREFDRGPVDDSFPLNGMQLQLRRSPEREQAAEALADELQRAGSARFHQWLTADQYAEQFGVAPEDIAKISEWLRAHGFTTDAPSPSQMTINFSGTAGQVREAFGTKIHALDVKGVRHIANVRDPQIPAALAPAIEGIVSLNDFRPRPMVVPRSQYTLTLDGNRYFALAPADLATIYDFNPLFSFGITGQGQTIALIEDSDVYKPNDWQTFRQTFGLNAHRGGSFTTVHPGGCTDPGINVNGDDVEAIVDAEWASAAAPGADLQLASCADTTTVFGGLIAIQNLVNQRYVPPIISVSYGECEAQNGAASNAAYKTAYLQAVLEGVSVFVAAGDSGAAQCDYYGPPAQSGVAVNALASTEYDVAVGGTDFGDSYAGSNANYWSPTNGPTYGSALSYVPEIPWNSSCASSLITSFEGYSTSYGANGFCASPFGEELLYPAAGSGGPATAPQALRPAASTERRHPTALAGAGKSRAGNRFSGILRMAFGTCRTCRCSHPGAFGATFTCTATRILLIPTAAVRAWDSRATGVWAEVPRSQRQSWPVCRRWSMRYGAGAKAIRPRSTTPSQGKSTARAAIRPAKALSPVAPPGTAPFMT
jgi:hypothetical protein